MNKKYLYMIYYIDGGTAEFHSSIAPNELMDTILNTEWWFNVNCVINTKIIKYITWEEE